MIVKSNPEICTETAKITYSDEDAHYCVWCGEKLPHNGVGK